MKSLRPPTSQLMRPLLKTTYKLVIAQCWARSWAGWSLRVHLNSVLLWFCKAGYSCCCARGKQAEEPTCCTCSFQVTELTRTCLKSYTLCLHVTNMWIYRQARGPTVAAVSVPTFVVSYSLLLEPGCHISSCCHLRRHLQLGFPSVPKTPGLGANLQKSDGKVALLQIFFLPKLYLRKQKRYISKSLQ